jgi:hypothetical protein
MNRRLRSLAANLGNVILQDRKSRFDCATGEHDQRAMHKNRRNEYEQP